jgi:hypothetical protein
VRKSPVSKSVPSVPSPEPVGHRFADLPPAARTALEHIEELLGELEVAQAACDGMASTAQHSSIEPSLPDSIARMLYSVRDRILIDVHTAMGRGFDEVGAR